MRNYNLKRLSIIQNNPGNLSEINSITDFSDTKQDHTSFSRKPIPQKYMLASKQSNSGVVPNVGRRNGTAMIQPKLNVASMQQQQQIRLRKGSSDVHSKHEASAADASSKDSITAKMVAIANYPKNRINGNPQNAFMQKQRSMQLEAQQQASVVDEVARLGQKIAISSSANVDANERSDGADNDATLMSKAQVKQFMLPIDKTKQQLKSGTSFMRQKASMSSATGEPLSSRYHNAQSRIKMNNSSFSKQSMVSTSRPESTEKKTTARNPVYQSKIHSVRNPSQSSINGSVHHTATNSHNNSQRSSVARLPKQQQSSRVSSNQKGNIQYVTTQQRGQMSGTQGSESTGVTRSQRSHERATVEQLHLSLQAQQLAQNNHHGIPLHPRGNNQRPDARNKASMLSGHSKQTASGFLTVNQTPKPPPLSCSNSQVQKAFLHYNSNQQVEQQQLQERSSQMKTGGDSSARQRQQLVPSSISQTRSPANLLSGVEGKIQRFDFKDYDERIEEQLRIPVSKRQQPGELLENSHRNSSGMRQNNEDSLESQLQLIIERQSEQKDLPAPQASGKTTPNMMTLQEQQQQQRVVVEKRQNIVAGISHNETDQSKAASGSTSMINLVGSTSQVDGRHVRLNLVNSSQSKPSSVKKSGASKITPNTQTNQTSSQKRFNFGDGAFDETLRDQGQAAIDERKMQQYHDVIKRVRLGIDDIKQLSKGSSGSKLRVAPATQRLYATTNGRENMRYALQQRKKSQEQLTKPSEAISRNHQDVSNGIVDKVKGGKDGVKREAHTLVGPTKVRKLVIEIPEDEDDDAAQTDKKQEVSQRSHNDQAKSTSSDGMQNGEENLVPSTEKKNNNRTKLNAYQIPQSGAGLKLMMTSASNAKLSAKASAKAQGLLLGKVQCNSTRNNTRYTKQIIDEDLRESMAVGEVQSKEEESKPLDTMTESEMRKPQKPHAATGNEKQEASQRLAVRNSAKRLNPQARGQSEGPPSVDQRNADLPQKGILIAGGQQADQAPSVQSQREPKHGSGSTAQRCLGIRSGSQSNVKLQNLNSLASANGLKQAEKFGEIAESRFGIQPAFKIIIPNDDPTRTSNKRTGVVRAYAANTNQGLVRNYNEDRVSIITNLLPPKSRTDISAADWPRCSYFAIYDGHGGSLCADFLRDNLHQFVIMEPCFPKNPKEAIVKGFAKAEQAFIDKVYNPAQRILIDKSGSCAIVVLIVQDMCYVANVGDSRAVLSSDSGQNVYPLSLDHKPGDEGEIKRIKAAGGEIYYRTAKNQIETYDETKADKFQAMSLAGPLRVLPGRLSVARTFGDPEAKIPELNGNPGVVIHDPDVKSFQLKKEHDYIMMGCDGIFDKMSNEESIMSVWRAAHDNRHHPNVKGTAQDVHKLCGMGVEYILKNTLLRRSLDNVTVVLIAFSNFKHTVFGTTSANAAGNSVKNKAAAQHTADEDSGGPNQRAQITSHSGTKTLERTASANIPRDYQKARQEVMQQQNRSKDNEAHIKQEQWNGPAAVSISQKKQSIVPASVDEAAKVEEEKRIIKRSPASNSTVSSENKRNVENNDPNNARNSSSRLAQISSQSLQGAGNQGVQRLRLGTSHTNGSLLNQYQTQAAANPQLHSSRTGQLRGEISNKPPLSQTSKATLLHQNLKVPRISNYNTSVQSGSHQMQLSLTHRNLGVTSTTNSQTQQQQSSTRQRPSSTKSSMAQLSSQSPPVKDEKTSEQSSSIQTNQQPGIGGGLISHSSSLKGSRSMVRFQQKMNQYNYNLKQ